jgi:hypothetical protein
MGKVVAQAIIVLLLLQPLGHLFGHPMPGFPELPPA